MRTRYKNLTEKEAIRLGFGGNFAFASDKIMSPLGIDMTPLRDINGKYTYETTTYDEKNKTIDITISNNEHRE